MELIPFFSTHENFDTGLGRKVHIGEYETGPLCRRNHPWITSSPSVTVDDVWVKTGLYSGNVCKDCARKYYKNKQGQPKT